MKYNQFRAMFAVSKASFRSITRSPSAVVFTLVFPLIFILVFGFINGGSVHLDVGVAKSSNKSNPIYYKAHFIPAIQLIESDDDNQQLKQLGKGELDAIINIVPSDVTPGKFVVELKTSNASVEKGVIARSMFEHLIDKANLEEAKVEHPMAELRESRVTGRTYKTIDFILPGQLGFSLLSSGVFGTAFVFFNLRQTLVIKRFFATPIRKPYIILGEAISRLVFALLGSVFLIAVGHFAFGFTLIHGFQTFFDLLVLSALGLIIFMGFGFVVSGIAKSESTIPPLANIVTMPQFLLAGTFFGIEAFPSWLQPICRALPLTYLNDAMRKTAFDGASLLDVWPQIGVILLWGVAIYALAVKTFRWE
ncbi:MAG: ABC transporter permease [Bacteroidota bacterium]